MEIEKSKVFDLPPMYNTKKEPHKSDIIKEKKGLPRLSQSEIFINLSSSVSNEPRKEFIYKESEKIIEDAIKTNCNETIKYNTFDYIYNIMTRINFFFTDYDVDILPKDFYES